MTIPVELKAWALRHHVSVEAIAELAATLGAGATAATVASGSEAKVASLVRIAAPHRDMRLWRNNVGVLKNENGVPVRYGLANDSPALNKRLKSSDLIGWRRLVIQPAHVGSHVAQFVAVETKAEDWRPALSGAKHEHEQAQQRWLELVAADGGYAKFVRGPGDL